MVPECTSSYEQIKDFPLNKSKSKPCLFMNPNDLNFKSKFSTSFARNIIRIITKPVWVFIKTIQMQMIYAIFCVYQNLTLKQVYLENIIDTLKKSLYIQL